ncbi:MAG: hypothetical protein AAB443_01835 [Patescibacteria group bacterium]
MTSKVTDDQIADAIASKVLRRIGAALLGVCVLVGVVVVLLVFDGVSFYFREMVGLPVVEALEIDGYYDLILTHRGTSVRLTDDEYGDVQPSVCQSEDGDYHVVFSTGGRVEGYHTGWDIGYIRVGKDFEVSEPEILISTQLAEHNPRWPFRSNCEGFTFGAKGERLSYSMVFGVVGTPPPAEASCPMGYEVGIWDYQDLLVHLFACADGYVIGWPQESGSSVIITAGILPQGSVTVGRYDVLLTEDGDELKIVESLP